jgi:hypothetical protein
MPFKTGTLRQRLFSIAPAEATFARRGFRQGNAEAVSHLEAVGGAFLRGYNAALAADGADELVECLEETAGEFRGFAFEGAAMALELLDSLTPWSQRRFRSLEGVGSAHVYTIHVGAGWAVARLPWLRRSAMRRLNKFDRLLGWLVIDGLGFHEGYFNYGTYARGRTRPGYLSGYGLRVFDQGLGRSLWFVEGADVATLPSTIAAFQADRRKDLWSGVGLACTYAGGVGAEEIERLKVSAGPYAPHFAQGATFAAKARTKAGIVTPHTESACRIICGMSASDASLLADDTVSRLPGEGADPAYEVWRRRVRAEYSRKVEFA